MNITDINYTAAITHFGSPASLARALCIKPQAVYQWGGIIPPLRKFELLILMNAKAPKAARRAVKGGVG